MLLSVYCFAQERVNHNDIYIKGKLAYNKADNNLFTGIAESRTGKGHLTYQEEYKDGYKTKYTLYYNGDTVIVANEIIYHDKSDIKKRETGYSSDGRRTWYTEYDVTGSKILKETYVDSKLVYSCEYSNNKKHGKEFCISKEGDGLTKYYENGKKVAKQ